MFHIANRVYLEYDYKFHQQYPYIVASSRWKDHPITISKSELIAQVPSFQELLSERYNNNIETFWSSLLSETRKLIVFVDPETMAKLQFQYWKSIFKDDIKAEDLHKLHASWIESNRLSSYYSLIGSWDRGTNSWSKSNAFTELAIPTLADSTKLFNETVASNTIKSMNKSSISFEYLMAEFFHNNASNYKQELLKRIEFLTWDNWLDELEHLKYEIISGNIDAGKLDTSLRMSIGNIESELAKSDLLKWTVDPAFTNDAEYIKANYDPQIFVNCYIKLAEVWQHDYDDMSQLSRLINEKQYEELLNRDVNRNYGCSYTRTRFFAKSNHVFATWCYDLKRKGQTSQLAPFVLR